MHRRERHDHARVTCTLTLLIGGTAIHRDREPLLMEAVGVTLDIGDGHGVADRDTTRGRLVSWRSPSSFVRLLTTVVAGKPSAEWFSWLPPRRLAPSRRVLALLQWLAVNNQLPAFSWDQLFIRCPSLCRCLPSLENGPPFAALCVVQPELSYNRVVRPELSYDRPCVRARPIMVGGAPQQSSQHAYSGHAGWLPRRTRELCCGAPHGGVSPTASAA